MFGRIFFRLTSANTIFQPMSTRIFLPMLARGYLFLLVPTRVFGLTLVDVTFLLMSTRVFIVDFGQDYFLSDVD